MSSFNKKWGLILKALIFVVPIVGLKVLFHYIDWEVIAVGSIVGTLLGGVFFVIAIILSGVMVDFKESEKIAGDLSASIETLYKDSMLVGTKASADSMRGHIRELIHIMIINFKRHGSWSLTEVNGVIDKIDDDIRVFAEKDVQLGLVLKFRNEIGSIKKISHRVEIIKETSFLPAGHAIAQIAVASALIVMLLLKLEPLYEGALLIGVVSMIFTSVILLIRDMDNPFEGHATVDLRQLYKLEKYLDSGQKKEIADGV